MAAGDRPGGPAEDGAPPHAGAAAPQGPAGPAPADAPARGVRVLDAEEFSVADAVGGWRGVVESGLPGLLFVVVFVATRALVPALVVAVGAAVVAVVVRLVQRTPPTQAFSGFLGVAIGAVWAWRTGEAGNYFAWGLWVNVAWGLGALVSVLVGWPVVGVVVSLLRGEDWSWRSDRRPAAVALRRRYVLATWVWVGVFGARLAVQVPLYLQGEDAVGWLGTARLVMGVPLFAVGLWLTWLLVAPRRAPRVPAAPPPSPPR